MYSLNDLIIISLSLLVVGLIFGYMFALKRSTSADSQRKLTEHLEKLESQQQDYQHKVNTHFSETAQLLNQLNESYQDVHSHLAKGAQLLCDKEHSDTDLQQLTSTAATSGQTESDSDTLMPPLDYAPKNGQDKGMLNEEFGLEKSQKEEQQTAPAL